MYFGENMRMFSTNSYVFTIWYKYIYPSKDMNLEMFIFVWNTKFLLQSLSEWYICVFTWQFYCVIAPGNPHFMNIDEVTNTKNTVPSNL